MPNLDEQVREPSPASLIGYERRSAKDPVIQSIQSNCIELKTTEPGDDFSDLQRLKAILADVDIIGLGEATHGTHEFFELKHRLLRFLVKEMGFDTLAFESSYAPQIRSSVDEGTVDPALALEQESNLLWQTEEIVEMITWMRDYNRQSARSQSIRFVGIDCLMNKKMIQEVIESLKRRDLHGPTMTKIEQLFDEFQEFLSQAPPDQERLQNAGRNLIVQLAYLQSVATAQHKQDSAQSETDHTADLITALTQIVPLYMVFNEKLKFHNLRDRFMAENISRIIEQGHKVVVWAHNGHIGCRQSRSRVGSRTDMGFHLRTAFGKRYYALALTSLKGSFRLFTGISASQEVPITVPPPSNIEHIFQRSGISKLIFDLRNLSDEYPEVRRWWSLPLKIQGAGQGFGGKMYAYPCSSHEYDGIAYVEETTSSRPL